MKKMIGFALFLGLVSLMFSVQGYAADGKKLFLEKCAKCHKSGGEAPVFAPTKYAGMQWERFFKRNKHKRKKSGSSTKKKKR